MGTAEIEKMTISQRLETMELLWDSIARSSEDISSPAWHGNILKARKQRIDSGEAAFMSLEQLRKRLR